MSGVGGWCLEFEFLLIPRKQGHISCPKLAKTFFHIYSVRMGPRVLSRPLGNRFFIQKHLFVSKLIQMSHFGWQELSRPQGNWAGGLGIARLWLSWGCVINPYLSPFVTRSGEVLQCQIFDTFVFGDCGIVRSQPSIIDSRGLVWIGLHFGL